MALGGGGGINPWPSPVLVRRLDTVVRQVTAGGERGHRGRERGGVAPPRRTGLDAADGLQVPGRPGPLLCK